METLPKKTDSRLWIGFLLIVLGGLLLLDSFDVIDFSLRHYLVSWKTLLIFIGLVIVASRNDPTTGYALIALGVLFWIPEFFDYSIRLSTVFWPGVLIILGFILLSRNGKKRQTTHSIHDDNFFNLNQQSGFTETSQEYIEDTAIFGGGTTHFTSSNFKGGKITAIFGGSDLYMKDAQPSPEGCVIDVLIIFGGGNLIVPDDWFVKSEMVSIFGGFSDKRLPAKINPEKTLILKGFVLFGGLELKSH